MQLKVPAPLDPGFRPLEVEARAYEKDVAASGKGVPFGVLGTEVKNQISHRAEALRRFVEKLMKENEHADK